MAQGEGRALSPGGVAGQGSPVDPAGAGQLWTGPGPLGCLDARPVIEGLAARGLSLAVAESLTGGLLGAVITAVPGASAVFRGGITAYAPELKIKLLGVPERLLTEYGTVHPAVASAMAAGARQRLGADVGVGVTGVAGPGVSEGRAPGTVHISVSISAGGASRTLALAGSREEIRRGTVDACLDLLWSTLTEETH